MLLSIPTIFLGINLFLPTHYVAYAFYSAWVLLTLVILIVNEIQIGQRSEQKDWDTNTKKPRGTHTSFLQTMFCLLKRSALKSNRHWRSEESTKKCSEKFLGFHGNQHCFDCWFVNNHRHNTVRSSNTCSWNEILWLSDLLFQRSK